MNTARQFLREYRCRRASVTVPMLIRTLESQGFTVACYSSAQPLLSSLGLTEYAAAVDAFTYQTEQHRIVFYNDRMSLQDQLLFLMHEEGHIFCDHASPQSALTTSDAQKELEANQFTLDLLRHNRRLRSLPAGTCMSILGAALLTAGLLWQLLSALPGQGAPELTADMAHKSTADLWQPDTSAIPDTPDTTDVPDAPDACDAPEDLTAYVYIPKGSQGTLYHTQTCPLLGDAEPLFWPRVDAERFGLVPCPDCLPELALQNRGRTTVFTNFATDFLFHTWDCPHLDREDATENFPESMLREGLSACPDCHPPVTSLSLSD